MPIPHLRRVHRFERHRSQSEREEKPKSRRKKWKRLFLRAFILGCAGSFLAVAAVFAWYSRDLPNPNKILERDVAQSTRIFARDGTTLLYEIHGNERRTIIPLEEIPLYMRQATIAIEDKNFYSHGGLAYKSIVRAAFTNLFTGSTQGASTITQQFIKNAVLTNERKLSRKVKEAVLTIEIERKLSKDEILQLYLNEIPYGSTAYGVESAAQTYFGKSAHNLSLAESAVLAALPQRPSTYSPYGNNRELLIGRQQYILDQMAVQGYISREEAEAAKKQELVFHPPRETIMAPHFVFFVKNQLVERFGEKLVEQGGLQVVTTLDPVKQTIAEEAIANGRAKVEKYGGTNAALVSLDTKNGDILAMVGNFDYFNDEIDGQVNDAIQPRQPGSSFKPLVYVTAFKLGYTPETTIFDLTTNFNGYTPKNYDGKERGPLSFRQALASSLNIPAVKVTYLIGLGNLKKTASAFHYSSIHGEDIDRCGLASALGCTEATLLEHTNAYASFAREGLYHPARALLEVRDGKNKTLYKAEEPKEERVFDEKAVRKLNDVLSDASVRTFGQSVLALKDRPLASKTGTTNEFVDAWAMGYTPSLATGVWVGKNKKPRPMKAGADGSVVAAPISHEYMQRALAGSPVETFKKPDPENIDKPALRGEVAVTQTIPTDAITGKRIPEECRDAYPDKYVIEKEFKEAHTILHWVERLNPRGPIPEHPESDPMYKEWEDKVQRWARGQGYTAPPKEFEDCAFHTEDVEPKISIISPTENQTLHSDTFGVTVDVNVSEGESVKKVEFFIDDELLHTEHDAPYTFTDVPKALEDGFHTLTVKVTDTKERFTEDSVQFNYTTDEGSLTLSSPTPNSVFSASVFPIELIAELTNPDSLEEVFFFARDENDTDTLITSVKEISSLTSALWSTPPSAGNYRLFARGTTKSGATIQSDFVKIVIEETAPL